MSAEYPWVYFVSFAHGRGFGSQTVLRRVAVDPVEAHMELRQGIIDTQPRQLDLDQVVVLNFQLMAWPGSCSSCGRAL